MTSVGYVGYLNENALSKLLNCGPEAACLVAPGGEIIFASAPIARVLGYSFDECPGRHLQDFFHEDDQAAVRKALLRIRSTPGQQIWLELRMRRKDGSTCWAEIIATNLLTDPEVRGIALYLRDITERKRAEDTLRESEMRFRELFASSPDAVFVEDKDGFVLDVNDAACRLHGLEREELLGRHVGELVPPEQREFVTRNFPRLFSGEIIQTEGFSLTKDNQAIPVEIRVSRIDYVGKQALLFHVRDITDRKRAEDNARRLASFPELNPNPVMELARDGSVNYANRAAMDIARAFGRQQPSELLPPDTAEIVEQCLASGDPRVRMELPCSSRILSWSFYPITASGVVHCYVGDITERRKLEEHLRQSQKMESVGQLAAGVAHDFNNLLTIIQGNAILLLAKGLSDPKLAGPLDQISDAAERAANLTRQLLLFSRKQTIQPRNLDLNEASSSLTKMLGRILGEHITLEFKYETNLPMVHADPGMVDQIIVNLAVNARDAMPRGGQLHIATWTLNLSEQEALRHPEGRPGRFVCLEVTDTGTGIPPEILPRIFEPFFTTKDVGKGTGLGLATVYGIVQQHQGWIEVASTVGAGTTFQIFFPASAVGTGDTDRISQEELDAPGGTEHILLVEDEPVLRSLVENILVRYGYQVTTAGYGMEAIELWNKHGGAFDLLLTDMVMPEGMRGNELAERLRKERPDLKVIFSSGYSAEATGRDQLLQEGYSYLQKPYRPQQLARAVRSCLDGTNTVTSR